MSTSELTPAQLAKTIDHTLLKPEATPPQVEKLCLEAKQNHFAAVCVNSSNVPQCADLLKGTDVKVCSVVGFPLGANLSPSRRSKRNSLSLPEQPKLTWF